MGDYPLITVMTLTYNRIAWLEQAIKYFQAQDYPNKEMLILDDSPLPHPVELPDVRYIHLPQRIPTMGEKRNLGTGLARGDIVCFMDDDDAFSPHYLSSQAAPILSDEADIVELRMDGLHCFDVLNWRMWRFSREPRFTGLGHGGTICYRRSLWESGITFPPHSKADEDVFLKKCRLERARFVLTPDSGSYVYVRHNSNIWTFHPGTFISREAWNEVAVEDGPISEDDLLFYRGRHEEMREERAL